METRQVAFQPNNYNNWFAMSKLGHTHPYKFTVHLLSIVILFFIGLQFYTAKHLRGFWPKFRRLQYPYKLLKPPPDPSLWPFVSYPMYNYAKYEGDTIKQYSIYATLDDSTEVLIKPEDLGINYWVFMYVFKGSLRLEKKEMIMNFVQLYESRYHTKIINLRLYNYPLVLLKDKIIEAEPQLVKQYPIAELMKK
ncbi:MAG: hypothetical protein RIC07_05645 [Coleofasciculus sp. E1-EBD-02]